ncbi:MAG: 2-polyprenylphenol 6-hydroxylase [Candidatus Puniceispirillales bacterium]
MLFLLRFPRVVFALTRGGLLGHIERNISLPPWLGFLMRLADRVLARRHPERPGVALAEALSRLGPAFIKLGQALSTRADLLGASVAQDLATLQDSLPPFPGSRARAIIADELGAPVETIFSAFDDTPVAAASIAQVHLATLADGEDVAVKILRPGVRQRMERDIRFFRAMARLMEFIAPQTRPLKLVHAVDQFAHLSDVELDLRLEGAAAGKLRENHANDDGIYVPRIFWQVTTERMLVLERVTGTRIDDQAALIAAGHNIDDITRIAARCFFVQVFRDGYFHADMHPGNIFIRDDGVLVPIDFGIMGDLSLKDRLFLARLLNAMLDRDYDAVARLHAEAGMISRDVPLEGFAQAIRAVTEPVMDKPMASVSLGAVLGQIFGLARRYRIEVQPQFNLLQKTMVMAEGVGRQLNPEANMWPIARELAEDWARDQQGLASQISSLADKMLMVGMRLPELLDKAESALDRMAATAAPEPRPRETGKTGLYAVLGGILIIIAILVHKL